MSRFTHQLLTRIVGLTIRLRKRLFVISLCVFLAVLFWLINSLSSPYFFTIEVPLRFENVPPGNAANLDHATPLKLRLEGTRWQFLFLRMKMVSTPLKLDLSEVETEENLLLKKHIGELNKQLPQNIKIVAVKPEVIHLGLGNRVTKKIPVKLRASIRFEKQYFYGGRITVVPDSVELTGPRQIVDKIYDWPTETAVLKGLKNTIEIDVSLVSREYPDMQVSVSAVKVTVPVEQFTEGVLQLPLRIKGNYAGHVVKLVPNHCKVYYQVGVSNYHLVRPEFFAAYVYLDENKKMLDVQLDEFPGFVRSVRVEPEQINYVIF